MEIQPSQLHIGALTSGKRFRDIEVIQSTDLEAMELDLTLRYASGQRWGFGLVHQQAPGQPYPVYKRGLVLLRYIERLDVFAGVYYTLADCGEDNLAVRATARMLHHIHPHYTYEEFYTHLLDHKKLYFVGLGREDMTIGFLA